MTISNRLESLVLFYNEIGCDDESATDAEQLEKVERKKVSSASILLISKLDQHFL